MPPIPFRRNPASPAHGPDTRITRYGYTFTWTAEHPTAADLEPLKHSYDRLGDAALKRLNEIAPPASPLLPRRDSAASDAAYFGAKGGGGGEKGEKAEGAASAAVDVEKAAAAATPPKRDLIQLLRDNADADPVLGELWREVNTVPDWVDWDQIKRGQDFFYRYGGPCLTGLAWQSLFGGLGSHRVVETLARTGGFRTAALRRRLYETTQHVLEVTSSLAAIQPGGSGWASSVRVRLLHAAVRTRILALAATHPAYYDTQRFGVPISDLDCLGTVGTFSSTVVWLSLPRQGIFARPQELDDYLALWRYVGYLCGTPVGWVSDAARARRFMESMLALGEIRPTATSRVLAGNMLACLAEQPPQMASRRFLEAVAWWLNGGELAREPGVPEPALRYKALVAGQCAFFMGECYLYRSVPWLDRKKIEALRRLFWTVIVEGKYGLKERTSFDFKHIPDLGKTTLAEGARRDADGGGPGARGVERRNLVALVVGVGVLAAGVWVGAVAAAWAWALSVGAVGVVRGRVGLVLESMEF